MRRVSVVVLALVSGISTLGCDSGEDDPSDAELFVGTWGLVSITDSGGDKTPILLAVANSLVAQLGANNTLSVTVDYKEQPDLNLAGTYTVDDGGNNLILTVGPQSPSFQYSFASDTRVTLTAGSDIVNDLFGTTLYTGTVNITIEKE